MNDRIFLCISFSLGLVRAEYNLIYTEPKCSENNVCPNMDLDTMRSIYPNSEERTQLTFINHARMFPCDYRASRFGYNIYGTYGDCWSYHDDGGQCGVAADHPLWLWPDAVEVARFHALADSECLTTDSAGGHNTCEDYCYLFDNDCSFDARSNYFTTNTENGAYISGEGLCGANMCYTDGHCGAMFETDSRYMGVGFAANSVSNGVTNVYVNGGPIIDFPIPIGTHFDQRIKTNSANFNPNDDFLTFQAIFYHESIDAEAGYVVYQGIRYSMTRIVGDSGKGIYEFEAPIPSGCEPYYFEFVTSNGNYRLPENEDYFFGTAWSPWEWWNSSEPNFPPDCTENHYYQTNGTVAANAGPNVVGITGNSCVGCSKVAALSDPADDKTRSLNDKVNGDNGIDVITNFNIDMGNFLRKVKKNVRKTLH